MKTMTTAIALALLASLALGGTSLAQTDSSGQTNSGAMAAHDSMASGAMSKHDHMAMAKSGKTKRAPHQAMSAGAASSQPKS